VRVLFYGQSITEQEWSRQLADWLRATYPNADLVIENRAIGGFASQMLVKTAEADLYPFYPDLVIFHVYGSHIEYDNIIHRLRQRTAAQVLMQTDHVTNDADLTEERDPAKVLPTKRPWSSFMNYFFLPETAAKYGCGLAQVRAEWQRYLRDNHLKAADFLKDGVHLNDVGCLLMTALLKPWLCYRPDLDDTSWRDLTATRRVGADLTWRDGRLTAEFDGNRVDLIAAPGERPAAPAKVLIDGKAPSAWPECYAATRCTAYPGLPWPAAMRVGRTVPWLAEDWTVKLRDATADLKQFGFEVSGSVTGPDGKGDSATRFVSNSGRVVIEPDDWCLARAYDLIHKGLPPGAEFHWRTVLLGADEYRAPAILDPTKETVTTVAQGLPNGHHHLELVATPGAEPPLAAIRAHRPPLAP
jgi:hypothetical protein